MNAQNEQSRQQLNAIRAIALNQMGDQRRSMHCDYSVIDLAEIKAVANRDLQRLTGPLSNQRSRIQ